MPSDDRPHNTKAPKKNPAERRDAADKDTVLQPTETLE